MFEIVTGEQTPVLRQKAQDVPQITKATKTFLKELEETMLAAKGVGIAAPQVGKSLRIFLAILGLNTPNERIQAFINPEIPYYSDQTTTAEEGCLSLPEQFAKVKRSQKIIITFQDPQGHKQTLTLLDFDARVVQHEYDHLNGILFLDRVAQMRTKN